MRCYFMTGHLCVQRQSRQNKLKVLPRFLSIDKHGSDEWGLLALNGHEEILKKSSTLKQLV